MIANTLDQWVMGKMKLRFFTEISLPCNEVVFDSVSLIKKINIELRAERQLLDIISSIVNNGQCM
jgi:hypothetical protein